jgi:hypothetical protein
MINPDFTRGEYWLLTTVAELAVPICWLDWEDIEEVLNKPGHGMDRQLLVNTLEKLFSDGLIVAHRFDHWDDCFVLSSKNIEIALDERQNNKEHFYRLTAKGGDYWEAFASPNWNFYISAGYELPEDNDIWHGELICTTKEHLEKYFQSLCAHDYEVDVKSIQLDVLEPWAATYWKELPIGHRIRFKCKDMETKIDPNTPEQINQEWYDSLWCNWR